VKLTVLELRNVKVAPGEKFGRKMMLFTLECAISTEDGKAGALQRATFTQKQCSCLQTLAGVRT
jgi:hypothetical protein